MGFPKGFLWGTSVSAAQIEGAGPGVEELLGAHHAGGEA